MKKYFNRILKKLRAKQLLKKYLCILFGENDNSDILKRKLKLYLDVFNFCLEIIKPIKQRNIIKFRI